MRLKEFKEEIAKLEPFWIASNGGSCIFCPYYMNPKDGYVFVGWSLFKIEEELDKILEEIKEHNKNTIIKEDVVEIITKDGIFKIKKNTEQMLNFYKRNYV